MDRATQVPDSDPSPSPCTHSQSHPCRQDPEALSQRDARRDPARPADASHHAGHPSVVGKTSVTAQIQAEATPNVQRPRGPHRGVGGRHQIQLTTSQFLRIFTAQRWDSHDKLILAAISPAAREAMEWTTDGLKSNAHVRTRLRYSTEVASSHSVERCVYIFSPTINAELGRVRWWLQRAPTRPFILCASCLEGRFALNAETADGMRGLDLGGSHKLMDISLNGLLPSLMYANFNSCSSLLFAPELHTAVHLRRLDLTSSAVMDLSALSSCAELEEVAVVSCKALTSLYGLAAPRTLRVLHASYSGLSDLSALEGCEALEEAYFAECLNLQDLSALAACPALRRVDVTGTPVRDVAPLVHCRHLTSLCMSECRLLLHYDGIPSLEQLKAKAAGLLRLADGVSRGYESLVDVNLNDCHDLKDVSSLAGAPNLQRLTASFSAVQSLHGLGSCPLLEDVDLSHCLFLRDVEGLRGARQLTRVWISSSPITSLDGLSSCKALKLVDVSSCKRLDNLSALDGLPELTTLIARMCSITSVVRRCPALTVLDVSGCKALADLSHLSQDSPRLKRLNASRSGITDARFLSLLTQLEEVNLDGCPLQDTTPLEVRRPRC